MTAKAHNPSEGKLKPGSRAFLCGPRVVLLTALLLTVVGSLCAEAPSEYQVKAAFLLNFTRFIDWPADAFLNGESPLNICILGEDPFGSAIDELVAGETVNGRELTVERLTHSPEPKSCQVLFISRSEKHVSGILGGLGPGVLTVSDGDEFLRQGGMISFVIDEHHVRFDVNQHAVAKAALKISARMLNVARIVEK